MPKYDLLCPRCDTRIEKISSYKEAKEYKCAMCGGKTVIQLNGCNVAIHVRWGKPKVRQKVKRMGA